MDDVRMEGTLSGSTEMVLNTCVCGCGCNCICICFCLGGVAKQANYDSSAWQTQSSKMNNRWYNNAVAGQGP